LIDDSILKGITHVVVDEVHERQWQVDILLVSLRSLLDGARPDLKVIMMSATLDTDLFSSFFGGAPVVRVPGRTYPVKTYYLEDLLEHTNHIIEEGSRYARRNNTGRKTVSLLVTARGGDKRREIAEYEMNEEVSDDYPGYSPSTRKSMDRVDETVINYDLIEDVLHGLLVEENCDFKPPDGADVPTGAVLIFLHGIGEIRTLAERLSGSRTFGNRQNFEIIPLHSNLSSRDQRRAFHASPKGCRKIIISTNIAETSVTIPEVTHVIDSGRVREIQRDKRHLTRKLVATWCSRASAKQRAGRAGKFHKAPLCDVRSPFTHSFSCLTCFTGRVQPGVCLKLFSSRTENNVMKADTDPELKRIPLEEVCLTILAAGYTERCIDFLSQTPQPPVEDAVRSALQVLKDLGAVSFPDSSEEQTRANSSQQTGREYLTPLGQHLAKLPVDARIGKMLIFGVLFRCTDAILTIAACLSASKSPFDSSLNEVDQVRAAHSTFLQEHSDFFTLLNVWSAFAVASAAGKSRNFSREKFLNYYALVEVREARQHYLDLLCGLGFINKTDIGYDRKLRTFDEKHASKSCYSTNSHNENIVHSVVCASLYPNVARVEISPSGETSVTQKNVQLIIHSTSVNSKLTARTPTSWMTFFEKLATERRVTISDTAFVNPFCLMLFGSSIQVRHTSRKVLVDDWIDLSVAADIGVVFRELREHLDDMLTDKILTSKAAALVDIIAELLLHG
jgi:HrpA-like RNA helicase